MTMLTAKKLADIYSISEATAGRWYPAIENTLVKYSIDTKLRIAAFLAQVGHESNRLNATKENLNYSASRLLAVFPKYFNTSNVDDYAGKPNKIGSRVYGNRLGNGSESTGEGFTYCGRGLIQVTGKENYANCSRSIGINLITNPDALLDVESAALSAGWFWNSKGLNNYADRSDFDTITRRINGGLNGKDDRDALYQRALKILSDEDADTAPDQVPEPDATGTLSNQSTPTANKKTVGEPAYTGTRSGYPDNIVYESISGHVVEFDDTPGNERIHVYHRSGSYFQIGPDGDITTKSVRDLYEITKEDKNQQTGGDETIVVEGQSFKNVEGPMVMKSGQDITLDAPQRVQVNSPLLAFSNEINGPEANFQNTTTTNLQAGAIESATAVIAVLSVGSISVGAGGGGGGGSLTDTFDIGAEELTIKKPTTFDKPATLGETQVMVFKPGNGGPPELCYFDTSTNKWMNFVTGAERLPSGIVSGS